MVNPVTVQTISGRRRRITLLDDDIELDGVKSDISKEFGINDGEVGDPLDFDLVADGRLLNDDNFDRDHLMQAQFLTISKKTYCSFAEHIISPYSTKMKWIFRVMFVITASLFVAASAQISFTLPYDRTVPVTFQTLAVLLVGSLLGPYMGTVSVLLYIFLGAVGLPFFASQSGGYAVLKGPTSGYLFGFLVATAITGVLSERGFDRVYILAWKNSLIVMLVADLSVYIVGVPVLSIFVGWSSAFTLGFVPFIPGDIIKILIATAIQPTCWRLLSFLFNYRHNTYRNVWTFRQEQSHDI